MMGFITFAFWVATVSTMALARWPLWLNTAALIVASAIAHAFLAWGWLSTLVAFGAIPFLILLNVPFYRRLILSKPLFAWYKAQLPKLSDTEKTALDAGGVFWEADIVSGKPKWNAFLKLSPAALNSEEQAFLDGPVERLCKMLDDWDITHTRGCLSPEVWDFLKTEGFFSFIIPKNYGGKGFSALCHSQVVLKVASRSLTAASIITVPNSLGPAELILHYGTPEQKDYYLPRLANGREIPCFALTNPNAGSDATAIPDTGVIKKGIFDGEEIIGIELNWDKRYITLAPVATLLGLAFKLYDPDKLLGQNTDLGITCALIPTNLPNITIGRRHIPLNIPFQNGPTQGNNVFIPLTYIIGGEGMVGQGWKMLVECLSVGRAISLPSTTIGCTKLALATTTAYARVREQFKQPIANFEGIKEAIAKMGGLTYIGDSTRLITAHAVDLEKRPSVAGAISKYHVTEISRKVGELAMDVQAGKAVMMGPKNLIARNCQGAGIGITVEGANILTRNMIIFGQGAIRCHPFIVSEMLAAQNNDLKAFDKALFGHIGHFLANATSTVIHAITSGHLSSAPKSPGISRYYQQISAASSCYAFLSDLAMMIFGGKLKFKENISARFADMLSYLYMASCCLKRYEEDGRPEDDRNILSWCLTTLLHDFWKTTEELIDNFPQPVMRFALKAMAMPFGKPIKAPKDTVSRALADSLTHPSTTRDRVLRGICFSSTRAATENGITDLNLFERALQTSLEAWPVRERLAKAGVWALNESTPLKQRLNKALHEGQITQAEAELLTQDDALRQALIAVDDFGEEHFGRQG